MADSVIMERSDTSSPECQHHWRIAAPNGATSMGVCKHCGAEREFANSTSESIWDNDHGESGFNRYRRRNNNEIAVTEEPEKPRASLRDLLGRSANDF
ncbi:MAG: hypothetical protein AB7R89_21625 [Dehalococcoidia bacterium]|jgi:hypothetical protein